LFHFSYNNTHCFLKGYKMAQELPKERSMSEMLGNQYFLARKYDLAAIELGSALVKDPENKGIRRKLIICYIQKGKIKDALDLFVSLLEEDLAFIIDLDPTHDDCPCQELIYDLEIQFDNNKNSLNYNLRLGMLWLYCDIKKSIQCFQTCQKLEPGNLMYNKILSRLKTYLLTNELS
jgi:tetratricopeptide (TPR) repeat protein